MEGGLLENSDWISISDAAKIISLNRTIDEARCDLLNYAADGILTLRSFRTRWKISCFSREENCNIINIMNGGTPFHEGFMPHPVKCDNGIEKYEIIDKMFIEDFRQLDSSGWTGIKFVENVVDIECNANWEISTLHRRELNLVNSSVFSEDKDKFFILFDTEWIKVEVEKSEVLKLFDLETSRESSALPSHSESRRGRKPANWWPDFAEELAAYIHEDGLPNGVGTDGQADMIAAIFARMVERGNTEPSRTQVQPVINAVLRRLRPAGK